MFGRIFWRNSITRDFMVMKLWTLLCQQNQVLKSFHFVRHWVTFLLPRYPSLTVQASKSFKGFLSWLRYFRTKVQQAIKEKNVILLINNQGIPLSKFPVWFFNLLNICQEESSAVSIYRLICSAKLGCGRLPFFHRQAFVYLHAQGKGTSLFHVLTPCR